MENESRTMQPHSFPNHKRNGGISLLKLLQNYFKYDCGMQPIPDFGKIYSATLMDYLLKSWRCIVKKPVCLILIVIILLILGCSGNSPDLQKDSNTNPISTSEKVDSSAYYPNVFGAWKIHLDGKNLSAEIIPSRNSQKIGDIYDSDLSQFLTVSPCADCLAITRVIMDREYNLRMDFRMRHPFSNLSARPDLHAFDVRLIFITPAQFDQFPDIKIMKTDGTEEGASPGLWYMIDPDGWTSHYDDLVTDERYFIGGTDIPGNINPFIRYFEDYAVTGFDPFHPDGQNVMAVGGNYETKTAIFSNYTMWEYGVDLYAVADVAYGQSAKLANRQNPQYYLPAFHRTEAWRVEYWIENNTIEYENPATSADIVFQVFDWQQGATVDPNYPNPSNKSGIPKSSNVAKIELSIPDLQDELVVATVPESGNGSPSDPLQYRLHVTNTNEASGSITGLLAVRDELYGQTGRIPVPQSPVGFPYETKDILDYSMYQIIFVNMPIQPHDPQEFKDELQIERKYRFTYGPEHQIFAQFFMDPGGIKFQYRWDYDYDGVTFDIDGSGLPSPEFEFTGTGVKHVGLRVRTNSVPPRQYIYDIPIYVEGPGFDKTIDTPGDHLDATYLSNNQAVAISGDRYYVAYTSEASGKRQVWLAVGDSAGSFTSSCITSSNFYASYNPSMVVVEDGVHDGVYVVFVSDDATHTGDLFSIYGNLYGSGFDIAHIKTVSEGSLSSAKEASLVYKDGSLYAYYEYWTGLGETDIVVSSSDDMGQIWTYHGKVNANAGVLESSPVAIYDPEWGVKKFYVVWEDYRDVANRGIDLYMASSSNGLDFSNETNISTFPDNTNEIAPSMTFHKSQLGIAYLAMNASTGLKNVYLKVADPNASLYFDYKIYSSLPNSYHTYPAVGTTCYGRFLVAYGVWDKTTHATKAFITEVKTDGSTVYWYDNDLYEIDAGTITSPDPSIFPGIASRSVAKNSATESLVVFTNYTNGETISPSPFNMYLGDVEAVQFISYSDETYP